MPSRINQPCPFAALLLALVCCLSGCAGGRGETRLAVDQGFREMDFQGEHFLLKGWLKNGSSGNTLYVYMEGDGRAWRNRRAVSDDPTPTAALGLRLARAHPGQEPVLYLARPGQYLTAEQLRECNARYWTFARFAEEVIADMNAAVETAKRLTGMERVALYGYSGGGAVAVLTAARRSDVAFLATVAGNLDHEFWTSLHGVTPLSQSLNPINAAEAVRGIPQAHLAGGDDNIVPVSVAQRFCEVVAGAQVKLIIIPGMRHEGAWDRIWKNIRETFSQT
ncbi:MAG: dienelactone hydrolase family protein [Desulfovibrionaceae bacterium]|nr:dienelactone hydrolase family protein [Desulfovibrionaceae bacterium]